MSAEQHSNQRVHLYNVYFLFFTPAASVCPPTAPLCMNISHFAVHDPLHPLRRTPCNRQSLYHFSPSPPLTANPSLSTQGPFHSAKYIVDEGQAPCTSRCRADLCEQKVRVILARRPLVVRLQPVPNDYLVRSTRACATGSRRDSMQPLKRDCPRWPDSQAHRAQVHAPPTTRGPSCPMTRQSTRFVITGLVAS